MNKASPSPYTGREPRPPEGRVGGGRGEPGATSARVRRLRSPGTFAEPAPEPEAKEPVPAEHGAVSPENVDYYHLTWFNTPHNRRWHVFAVQTRESESRSMPCSPCAVLGTFAVLES